MLNWFKSLFYGKSLDSVLQETKFIRINGIRFQIKKIDVMNFLDGSKVMLQYYDTFKLEKGNQDKEMSHKKIREHMKEILCAGVVNPKLSLNDENYKVDKMFVNMKLVNKLYEVIMKYTYGDLSKKKII